MGRLDMADDYQLYCRLAWLMTYLESRSQRTKSMANTTTKRGHRPRKNATRITANLNNLAVTEKSSFDMTKTIDLALEMLSIVIDAAHAGNPSAIALLSRMGLELKSDEIDPIIVKSGNGDIAAWII